MAREGAMSMPAEERLTQDHGAKPCLGCGQIFVPEYLLDLNTETDLCIDCQAAAIRAATDEVRA